MQKRIVSLKQTINTETNYKNGNKLKHIRTYDIVIFVKLKSIFNLFCLSGPAGERERGGEGEGKIDIDY